MKYKLILLLGALLITNAFGALTYNFGAFNVLGNGTVPPAGPAPWLTFQVDEIDADSVQLTVTSKLIGQEFYSGVAINLNSSYDFSATTPTFSNYTQTGLFTVPTVEAGNNIWGGPSQTKYDLAFNFATGGDSTTRFDGFDAFSFRIDGVGINAFETEAVNNPAIAHVQSILIPDGTTSAWLTSSPTATQVPEPSALLLGGLGIAGLLRRRR